MARDDKSSYYDAGGIESLDVIKAKLTTEQYIGFLLGNSLKYHQRLNFKHAGAGRIRDAQKSLNYTQWLRDALEEQQEQEKEKSPEVMPTNEALAYWDRAGAWP